MSENAGVVPGHPEGHMLISGTSRLPADTPHAA